MAGFAVRRLGAAALTAALVVTLTFVLAHLAPGEPMLGEAERLRADPQRIARVRAEFGLDRSLPAQFALYAGNAVRGNLGESFTMRRSVAAVLAERLPNTALLAGASLLIALAIGIGIAVLQAARAGSTTDALLGTTTLVFHSTPAFWLGLVLLLVFGQWLGWLPVAGMTTPVEYQRMGTLARLVDVARHLLLPALTLALVQTAEIARYQRGALVDALGSEFVRAARARGLSEAAVLLRHALRSALAPVVVLAGMSVPMLLAGAVLVESVFGWPGMGRLTHDAIQARDYNLILAAGLLSGLLVALGNLAADLAARALDPPERRVTAWQRVRRRPAALLGLAATALVLLIALLAPLLAPHDPLAMPDPVGLRAAAPSATHWLGTDAFSRDVLSRLLFGARVSLVIGIASALGAAVIGGIVGFAAGLGTPLVDGALMRGVDVLLALPRVFLLLAVFALWEGVPLGAIILLIALTGWFPASRLVRAHVRQLRESDWARATLALGGGASRLARHLLPHVAATLIVSVTLDIGSIILLEAGLSFLGLGVGPPTPTWGNMILEGRSLLFTAPWVAIAPGLALTGTVVAFNLLGDGLRDALDPRTARRQDGTTAGVVG